MCCPRADHIKRALAREFPPKSRDYRFVSPPPRSRIDLASATRCKDLTLPTPTKATVLGNYVYIDGGEVSQLINGLEPKAQTRVANRVNTTIRIDLSESWTASDVSMRQIDKPWSAKRTQTVWTDLEGGHYYLWGGEWVSGERTETDDDSALWKFTPDATNGGSWTVEAPKNPVLFQQLAVTKLGAFASTNKTGFVIGGLASGLTDSSRGIFHNQAVPGMVAFNMETRVWEDGTTGFSPIDGTLVGASAQWVPNLGPNGLIMVLGGVAPVPIQETTFADATPFDFRNLTFFDPETKQSYWQIATGNIPPSPRSKFCATGFQNADGGYEMTLTTPMPRPINGLPVSRRDRRSLDSVEWSSDQVRRLFTTNNPTDTTSSSPSPSDSQSGDSTAVSDSQNTVPAGAIAGGVVGGVAGLALLAAAAWFFMRRRKNKASEAASYYPPGTHAPEVVSPSRDPKKWHNRGAELEGSWVDRPELAADREFAELPEGRR
ncbi:hypothetical protein F5144DRAFT_479164 [Chaetomium tenue]|uniref:Uncharacterized protein n=1 Tax=Chaetomium tenue TaxID=1854479 RepID=A0ACB7PSR5_9PEZI|nr:hypothetical protein F5144DRAFT_479164 [Chaetomium globosum]